ncbi:IclR family transcriptional regulator [Halorubrum sp. DTA98]|uniref:IclR family transcriptional regulator n=1 Tax=Halorubrum sp. DTA98 TaxID=3402163 RepID=UPI003AAD3313
MDGNSELSTVERALEVLELLWDLNGAGPTEVAERLDVPKGTVHGYLRTLTNAGYTVNEGGTYRVSYRFLTMGGRLKHRSRLFHVAKPEVERLADETGEIVDVSIEENGHSVTLHHAMGDQSLRLGLYPGMTTPIHAHAAGKAVLAYLPADRRDEILAGDLEAMTERTITDPEDLREELATVRDRTYAYDWDQQVTGMGVVAAPILVDDEVLGSIAIIAPTDRLQNHSYREELIRYVREASNTVEVSYQYSN